MCAKSLSNWEILFLREFSFRNNFVSADMCKPAACMEGTCTEQSLQALLAGRGARYKGIEREHQLTDRHTGRKHCPFLVDIVME